MKPLCRIMTGTEIRCLPDIRCENELRDLIRRESGAYSGEWVCGQLDSEFFSYAVCCSPQTGRITELTFYNDSDDYEDEIEFGSERWKKMMMSATE